MGSRLKVLLAVAAAGGGLWIAERLISQLIEYSVDETWRSSEKLRAGFERYSQTGQMAGPTAESGAPVKPSEARTTEGWPPLGGSRRVVDPAEQALQQAMATRDLGDCVRGVEQFDAVARDFAGTPQAARAQLEAQRCRAPSDGGASSPTRERPR